jgi:predicted transposase YbfD/YdcC
MEDLHIVIVMEICMKKADLGNFLDNFCELSDPRSSRNRLYSMDEILLTTICACICGADGWQDIEDYGNAQIDFLRTLLPYKNGIPSDDTFRRFFRALDPSEFQKLFCEWMLRFQNQTGAVIAIDGKASRHSFDESQRMLHMVSAYATEARLVLAQEKVDEKSNEITAIPLLLNVLDLRGSTVTIDAAGCQYGIAKQIIEKEGNYILALKGNQSSLHQDVKDFFADQEVCKSASCHEDFDKGHGRMETRKCRVITDVQWLKNRHSQWNCLNSIICVESTREIRGKTTKETRYYISSLQDNSRVALKKIRNHWAIENSLHWVLDMSFGDDQSRIRKENAPQIMVICRHIALNLLQKYKQTMPRQSIRRLRKMAGWNHISLSQIISQNFS